ncbi:Cocaine esterase [Penicillium subrubescens]|uniref:Cocaine esterase n=1 Tax=Penicillium subrubescens TaxID=1316194 RepID=A0A1Q5UIC2_9EURO|nr:Cocaine esterase [Penicillium subrubescens]
MPTTAEDHQSKHPDLEWHQLPTPEAHPRYTYRGFQPGRSILTTGHFRSPGWRPFTADTILDNDVSIPMRDGIKLYADIFRPCSSEGGRQTVPAIIPWSPYGKTGNGCLNYDNIAPFRVGLHLNQTSGYEKFEGPDPADWVPRGYAIINIDARGAGDSEGNMVFWGQQEAEDIYDAIDWISKQTWCNGSVGMAGNS